MKHRILIALLVLLLVAGMSVCAFAQEALVVDNAGLLTEQQERELQERLQEISDKYDAQMIVYTVSSSDGWNMDRLVNYLYDSNNWGYGKDRDGVLLLVCMNPREYRILSNGYAGKAISEDIIDSIGDEIRPDLSDGDYEDAFQTFADECEYYLNCYLNGFPFNYVLWLVIAVVAGLVVGFITVSNMKGKLKTVRSRNQANDYVKAGSLNVTTSREYFLYRDVTSSPRSDDSSSSSGSSSGSSRSVGGGSF